MCYVAQHLYQFDRRPELSIRPKLKCNIQKTVNSSNNKYCFSVLNGHEIECCECENCFRANGGTFVYNSDDLVPMEQSNGTVLYESKQPKEKWEEKEIREMISIWGTKEVLVNSKHPLYYNTKERTRAVEEIRNELAERGNEFTFKQVNDKMINLRTYTAHRDSNSRRQNATRSLPRACLSVAGSSLTVSSFSPTRLSRGRL